MLLLERPLMPVPTYFIRNYLEDYLVQGRAFASLAWLNIQYAMQDNLALLPYERNRKVLQSQEHSLDINVSPTFLTLLLHHVLFIAVDQDTD